MINEHVFQGSGVYAICYSEIIVCAVEDGLAQCSSTRVHGAP